MDKKVIYLDDVLEAIEKCEHYPLFDTKKIKEGIVDFLGLGIGYWDIKEAIEQLPSAQPDADFVTVVRCKDCKHNQCKSTSGNALCELFYGMTDQMGFCHCGERRNGWED